MENNHMITPFNLFDVLRRIQISFLCSLLVFFFFLFFLSFMVVDIQQVEKLENGSCYTRVILLTRKIRAQIDKIKRQKGYNMPKIQQAQKVKK
jgi:hypothetical protein